MTDSIVVKVTVPGNEDRAYSFYTPFHGLPLTPESLREVTMQALLDAVNIAQRADVLIPEKATTVSA